MISSVEGLSVSQRFGEEAEIVFFLSKSILPFNGSFSVDNCQHTLLLQVAPVSQVSTLPNMCLITLVHLTDGPCSDVGGGKRVDEALGTGSMTVPLSSNNWNFHNFRI